MGNEVLSLFCSLTKTIAMKSPFLNDIVRDEENIQLPSVDTSARLIFSQEMPTSAVNDALIPLMKAF